MAKERLELDAKSAIKEMAKLNKHVSEYNKIVVGANKVVATAVKRSKDFASAVGKQGRAMEKVKTEVRSSNTSLKTYNRNMEKTQQLTKDAAISTGMVAKNIKNQHEAFKRQVRSIQSLTLLYPKYADALAMANDKIKQQSHLMTTDSSVADKMARNVTQLAAGIRIAKDMAKLKNAEFAKQTKIMDKDRMATLRLKKEVSSFQKVLERVTAIVSGIGISRGINALTMAFREATIAAGQFSIKIAEVQTLSLETGNATAQWAKQLTSVSNVFGSDIFSTAEAAYQTLSNQIIQASEAQEKISKTTAFLRQQNLLATATVTDLATATNATSSVLNAFNENVGATARVNTILFATIERGRLRLEDIANTLGRVSVLSNQLGISFIEQQSAIALFTRQGIKASEALTLLRNIQLRLLKPTEAMQEIFEKWGVSSGAAAVQAFGLAGVIERLRQEAASTGDEITGLGTLFGRLRSIQGGVIAGTQGLGREIGVFREILGNNIEASQKVLESFGKRSEIQMNRVRNLFINTVGAEVQRIFVEFSESVGGLDNFLVRLYRTVSRGSVFLASYVIAVKTTSIALQVWAARASAAAGAMALLNAAVRLSAFGAIAYGLSLIIDRFLLGRDAAAKFNEQLYDTLTAVRQEFETVSALGNQIAAGETAIEVIQLNNAVEQLGRAYAASVASIGARNNELKMSFKDTLDSVKIAMEDIGDRVLDPLGDKISDLVGELRSARSALAGRAEGLRGERREQEFRERFTAAGRAADAGDLSQFEQQIKLYNEAFQREITKGDLNAAKDFKRLTDRFIQEYENRVKRLRDANAKLETKRGARLEFRNGKARINPNADLGRAPVNAQAAEEYGKKVLEIERKRNNLVKERIAFEQKFIDKEAKKVADELKAAQAREKAFGKLQETLAKIDAFKGDPRAFAALAADAREQTTAAGVKGLDRVNLLREVYKKEQVIRLKALTDAQDQEILNAQNTAKKITEILKGRVQAFETAKAEELRITTETSEKQLEAAATLENVLKRFQDTAVKRSLIPKFRNEATALTLELSGYLASLNKFQKDLKDATNKGNTDRVRELLKSFGDLRPIIEEFKGASFRLGTITAKENMVMKEARDLHVQYMKNVVAVDKALRAKKDVQTVYGKALDELQRLQRQYPQFKDTVNDALEAMNEKQKTAVDLTRELLQQLRTLNNLQVQIDVNASVKKGVRPGPLQRAFGGMTPIGPDYRPAMTRPGEYIVNPMAARRNKPLLDAINNGNIQQQTFNFGGFTVNGGAGMDARRIAAEVANILKQQQRLGVNS